MTTPTKKDILKQEKKVIENINKYFDTWKEANTIVPDPIIEKNRKLVLQEFTICRLA